MAGENGLVHGELTYGVIGCCQRVHSALGPGFPESVYHKAMCQELTTTEIPFETEKGYEVEYAGTCCGQFRADLVVADRVIVELKAVAALNGEHLAQVLSYLKASGLHVGLLVNSGLKSLETKRVAL